VEPRVARERTKRPKRRGTRTEKLLKKWILTVEVS